MMILYLQISNVSEYSAIGKKRTHIIAHAGMEYKHAR